MVDTAELRKQTEAQGETQQHRIIKISTLLELLDRLDAAEKVAKAAIFYIAHENSPLCIGWDDYIDALAAWQKTKEATP